MLGSSTLDFLRPYLVVEGARDGYAVDLFVGEFGQLEQVVLDETSTLYEDDRDLLVLAFQPEHLAPDVFDRFYASDGQALDELTHELTDRLVAAARAFRDRAGRPVLVANFLPPKWPPLGPYDSADPAGLTHRLAATNRQLAERLSDEADVYVWDLAGLVRSVGADRWSDPRLRMLARVDVAAENQPAMARHLLRSIRPLRRPPAKCLVLDLDNTLWGGVIGDDGIEGVKLSDDFPGIAFKSFQRAALGLRDRGILLAVVSKNDEDVASEVFRRHPEMLIGWDDLAAVRINWDPKSGNMREIAQELNIGTDALVLFDDNPVERAEVRSALPEAGVIDVPTDPSGYRDALMSSGFFDQLGLSHEDFGRAEMYRLERSRRTLRDEAATLEDFLAGLDMEAEVGEADGATLGRIAQLVGKTNQFNLTTRRHTPAELAAMTEAEDRVVAWLRLSDRFGDQGLISVGILEKNESEARLDTFLMSCRVMNREVERAMMVYLAEHAAALGCTRLVGEYRPTAKNHMVEGLFSDLGFEAHGETEEASLWKLDLHSDAIQWPAHIARRTVARAREVAGAQP